MHNAVPRVVSLAWKSHLFAMILFSNLLFSGVLWLTLECVFEAKQTVPAISLFAGIGRLELAVSESFPQACKKTLSDLEPQITCFRFVHTVAMAGSQACMPRDLKSHGSYYVMCLRWSSANTVNGC